MKDTEFESRVKYIQKYKPRYVGLIMVNEATSNLHMDIYTKDDYEFLCQLRNIYKPDNIHAIVDGAILEHVCQDFRIILNEYTKRHDGYVDMLKKYATQG